MANLKDLINLAKIDGGKVFVVGEDGDIKLVILSPEEYERLLIKKLGQQVQDIEEINKEILKAQLQDTSTTQKTSTSGPSVRVERQSVDLREEVIDPSFDFEAPKGEWEEF